MDDYNTYSIHIIVGFLANPGRFSWIGFVNSRCYEGQRHFHLEHLREVSGGAAWRLGTASLKNWTGLEYHEILMIENYLKLNMSTWNLKGLWKTGGPFEIWRLWQKLKTARIGRVDDFWCSWRDFRQLWILWPRDDDLDDCVTRVCGHQLEAVLQAHPSRNQAGMIAVADTHGCHSSKQGPTQIVSSESQSVRHSWIFGCNPKVHHSTDNTQSLAEEYEELHQREAIQQLRLCIYYGKKTQKIPSGYLT